MKYSGMTLIGTLLTAIMVCISGLLVLRIVPVYIQYYEVVSSIKSLSGLSSAEFSGDMQSNISVLKSKLMNQFNVNSIEEVKVDDVKMISNPNGGYDVLLKYDAKRPLFANISLLFHFDINEEVKISAS